MIGIIVVVRRLLSEKARRCATTNSSVAARSRHQWHAASSLLLLGERPADDAVVLEDSSVAPMPWRGRDSRDGGVRLGWWGVVSTTTTGGGAASGAGIGSPSAVSTNRRSGGIRWHPGRMVSSVLMLLLKKIMGLWVMIKVRLLLMEALLPCPFSIRR